MKKRKEKPLLPPTLLRVCIHTRFLSLVFSWEEHTYVYHLDFSFFYEFVGKDCDETFLKTVRKLNYSFSFCAMLFFFFADAVGGTRSGHTHNKSRIVLSVIERERGVQRARGRREVDQKAARIKAPRWRATFPRYNTLSLSPLFTRELFEDVTTFLFGLLIRRHLKFFPRVNYYQRVSRAEFVILHGETLLLTRVYNNESNYVLPALTPHTGLFELAFTLICFESSSNCLLFTHADQFLFLNVCIFERVCRRYSMYYIY